MSWKEKIEDKMKIVAIYDFMFVIAVLIANIAPENIKVILYCISIIIGYFTVIVTYFIDTNSVILIDPHNSLKKYSLRFLPIYILLMLLTAASWVKVIIMLSSLILTRNDTIKDEYFRLFSLAIYIYLVKDLINDDFTILLIFLYWYHILYIINDYVINNILSKRIIVFLLDIYMRFFIVRKIYGVGIIFNLLLFSTPFFFYYFFDARILGIIIMNIVLTILLLGRYCYVKVIIDPRFAFALAINISIPLCEKYFTAVTTLINHEAECMHELFKFKGMWVVYMIYEGYRANMRSMIEIDVGKLRKGRGNYIAVERLEQVLIEFYEQGVLPYDKSEFLQNKHLLSDYFSIENMDLFETYDTKGFKEVLANSNFIEVKLKNPLYFLGFFSEKKFFLSR